MNATLANNEAFLYNRLVQSLLLLHHESTIRQKMDTALQILQKECSGEPY